VKTIARPMATRSRAPELSEFHTERMRVYAAASMLLSHPPAPRTLAELRVTFDATLRLAPESRAHRELCAALCAPVSGAASEEFSRLFQAPQAAETLACSAPLSAERHAVYAAALEPSDGSRSSELRAIAVLADRTAWAVARGEFAEAGSLCDVQARWLHREGHACLEWLQSALDRSDTPFYRRVGLAVRFQIEDDMKHLSLPKGGAP
jgi:hypothetical protein